MKKPILLLDVDEVLADFVSPALDCFHQITGKRYVREDFNGWGISHVLSKEQFDQFDSMVSQPGYCYRLPILPGAKEAVRELRELAEVHPCTSPWDTSPTWMHERKQWLVDHFGFPAEDIIQTAAKYRVSGDYLLDDKPKNVKRWQTEQHGTGLLWHTVNTTNCPEAKGLTRVCAWENVIELVGAFNGFSR